MWLRGLVVVSLALACCTYRDARAADSPIGFGQATTGGCPQPRCICHVRAPTQDALMACLAAPGPGTIVFDSKEPISIDSPAGGRRATVKIPSNKTLAGPATLISNGTTLEIDGQSNIVIRDIAFRSTLSDHPECRNIQTPKDSARCGIAIYVLGASKNVWIDHNDFSNCGEKCIEVWGFSNQPLTADGRVAAPDLITVSNNRFSNSYFGVAIGVDARATEAQIPLHERATFYNNLFDHVFRRSPRAASHAWIHAFNNYVRDWGDPNSCAGATMGFGPSATGQAQLVLENNVLEAWNTPSACKQAVDISDYVGQVGDMQERGVGLVRASANKTLNGALVRDNGAAQVFNPRDYYSYTLLSPDAVAATIPRTAGVRSH